MLQTWTRRKARAVERLGPLLSGYDRDARRAAGPSSSDTDPRLHVWDGGDLGNDVLKRPPECRKANLWDVNAQQAEPLGWAP